eukprot:jgi/Botrbrau1/10322/Bobra.0321s0003.1
MKAYKTIFLRKLQVLQSPAIKAHRPSPLPLRCDPWPCRKRLLICHQCLMLYLPDLRADTLLPF